MHQYYDNEKVAGLLKNLQLFKSVDDGHYVLAYRIETLAYNKKSWTFTDAVGSTRRYYHNYMDAARLSNIPNNVEMEWYEHFDESTIRFMPEVGGYIYFTLPRTANVTKWTNFYACNRPLHHIGTHFESKYRPVKCNNQVMSSYLDMTSSSRNLNACKRAFKELHNALAGTLRHELTTV